VVYVIETGGLHNRSRGWYSRVVIHRVVGIRDRITSFDSGRHQVLQLALVTS
jgi:hypothetical protein